MLRVLTLSTLFPHVGQPNLGVFVERQTLGLAARGDVLVEVVSPIGLPPGPLARHPHYAQLAELPLEEEWKGLAVHRPRFPVLPVVGAPFAAWSMAQAILPTLRRIRERFPFDVIDAEYFWPDGPAAQRLSRALGVPFSIKARGSDIQYWGTRPGISGQIVRAGRAAHGLLAVSGSMRRSMAAIGMSEEKIRVHYTGVDLARFAPADRAAAKAALDFRGPLVASVGALLEKKGQRIALDAIARLPGVHLILIGDGPDHDVLEARAHALGIESRVHFLGARPHDELPALLAAADVMVLPSASEGLANAWVEALACGTPVVTSDVGGVRELIDRPEAGRIVAREAGAVAAAIAELLEDPPPQQDVRAVTERFTWEANADALFDHLSRVARQSVPATRRLSFPAFRPMPGSRRAPRPSP